MNPGHTMRVLKIISTMSITLMLGACSTKTGTSPDDPYESYNRKTYKFNEAFDATFLKPPAKFYAAVFPAPVRAGVNNFFDNINMIPSVANDLLQAEWNYAIKDTWRFVINTSMGIGGVFDAADHCNLPPHSNDLGITFAKWGDKKSPYLIIPFLGPSTFRDGMGMMFNFTLLTPYPYFSNTLVYSLLGVRYIDLRSQMLESERLMADALDKYSFMRDAYLQHRNYLITGEKAPAQGDSSALYVDDQDSKTKSSLLPEEPANGTPSDFPLTTAHNAPHRTVNKEHQSA